eukprot:1311376-Amorphochlora_amoeboformis.AAC.1
MEILTQFTQETSRKVLTSRGFSKRDMARRHTMSRYIWKPDITGYYPVLPARKSSSNLREI